MSTRSRLLTLGLGLGILGLFSCTLVIGLPDVPVTDGGNSDGGGDAPADDGGTGGDVTNSCHRTWSARPAADDDASVQDLEFFLAVQSFAFGDDAGLGFDLDDTCTCPGPDSCTPFGDSGPQCDFEGGVDNSGGALIAEFSGSTNLIDQQYVNDQIASGAFSLLIEVAGYNGQADDTHVTLSVFSSEGTEGVGTDAGPSQPKFDGTDRWTIDPASLLGGTITDAGPLSVVAYDLNAYVVDSTLVANVNDLPVTLRPSAGAGFLTIDLSGAVVVANLNKVGSQFSATGTITGRWASRNLLTALQVLHDPFDSNASLCGTDTVYQLLKSRICGMQDIAVNPTDDGKGTPCSALSLAIGFTGASDGYGSAYAPPPSQGGCGPQWTDQCGP